MSDIYTTDDFLRGVTVTYWGGEYAAELLALHFPLHIKGERVIEMRGTVPADWSLS